MRPLITILQIQQQYSQINFDPANVYLAASTVLLSVCVYFLKRHVDGQDKVIERLDAVIVKMMEIETNGKNTNEKVDHIFDKVEKIEEKVNGHEYKIQVLQSKIPA